MTYKFENGERWVKSGLLGPGIEAHYDIDRITQTSHGPVIAQVLVSHVTEEARRTASDRADLICSIHELINRAESAEAERDEWIKLYDIADDTAHKNVLRADKAEQERDELRRQLDRAHAELSVLQDALRYIMQTDSDKFMMHTFKQICSKAEWALKLNEVKP